MNEERKNYNRLLGENHKVVTDYDRTSIDTVRKTCGWDEWLSNI